MTEKIDYRIELPERDVILKYGKTMVSLCRLEPQYNYVAIEEDDGKPFRMFGAEGLCYFVAGYAPTFDKEDGCYYRYTVYDQKDDQTFFEKTGWNPIVIEKDHPLEWEKEAYIEVQLSTLDKDLDEL